jgi:HSP20 family protein
VDEDELKFNWKPEMLTIGGHRDFDHDAEDAEEYIQIQRTYGHFSCAIPLDRTLDIDQASAKYRRGVLKVRIPRRRVYG